MPRRAQGEMAAVREVFRSALTAVLGLSLLTMYALITRGPARQPYVKASHVSDWMSHVNVKTSAVTWFRERHHMALTRRCCEDWRNDSASHKASPNASHAGFQPPLIGNLTSLTGLTLQQRDFLNQPVVNLHDYGYLHNPVHFCKHNNIDVLFVTPSAVAHFNKRRDIRKYGYGFGYVKVLFFLGIPEPNKNSSSRHKRKIEAEIKAY